MGRGLRLRRAWRSGTAVQGYFAASCLILTVAAALLVLRTGLQGDCETQEDHGVLRRDVVWTATSSPPDLEDTQDSSLTPAYNANCTLPTIANFPRNVMSLEVLRHGGFLINLAAVFYMFGVLALVCDSYFMSSLEILCADLKLSEDVAGASFMAIGGSAPELFTSIFGVFIAKGNIGVGTVIGSAVFNILCVIGLCGLLAGQVVRLTRWPLARDFLCYTITVIILVIVIMDNQIHWWESMVFILLYIAYLVLLYFDPVLRGRVESYSMCYNDHELDKEDDEQAIINNGPSDGEHLPIVDDQKTPPSSFGADNNDKGAEKPDKPSDDPNSLSPFAVPSGRFKRFLWLVSFPPSLLFYLTIPNCSLERWRRWYPVTFMVSLAWIGGVTYLLVWMVTIIGYVLMLPDTVMGLTLLAAGSSTPDTILSIIAARNGYGDMAICHSIGSNIFDILIGLGLPWFLYSTAVYRGLPVPTNSHGLTIIAGMLVLTVIVTLVVIKLSAFRLDKKVGALLVGLYLLFLVPAILLETNVIIKGLILPTCPLSD